MNQSQQSDIKVSEMVEGQLYIYNDWFFTDRSNETTLIKKESDTFYVTYRGGDFKQDQTVVFNDDAFEWIEWNVKVSNLTITDIEEAVSELYNLHMSNDHEEMKKHVQVIVGK